MNCQGSIPSPIEINLDLKSMIVRGLEFSCRALRRDYADVIPCVVLNCPGPSLSTCSTIPNFLTYSAKIGRKLKSLALRS